MAPEFSVEEGSVPKFTGSNYRPWSMRLKRLLQSKELWKVVVLGPQKEFSVGSSFNDKKVAPVPTGGTFWKHTSTRDDKASKSQALEAAKNDETTAFYDAYDELRTNTKDAQAATIIMGCCSQDVLEHIVYLETAKEQWFHLQRLYNPLVTRQLGQKTSGLQSVRAT
jgi:hypothetical protein